MPKVDILVREVNLACLRLDTTWSWGGEDTSPQIPNHRLPLTLVWGVKLQTYIVIDWFDSLAVQGTLRSLL